MDNIINELSNSKVGAVYKDPNNKIVVVFITEDTSIRAIIDVVEVSHYPQEIDN